MKNIYFIVIAVASAFLLIHCDAAQMPGAYMQQFTMSFQNGHFPDTLYTFSRDTTIKTGKQPVAGLLEAAETSTVGYSAGGPFLSRYLPPFY
ncbi:MAG: hypothetical protein JW904_05015 [Spirochaetales bacterium]|nr:hypothetical protein [Spirochaetales bacterium]